MVQGLSRPRLLCGLDHPHSELYEAAFTGVIGATGATAAFVFGAPARFTGTAFLAGADFFAAFPQRLSPWPSTPWPTGLFGRLRSWRALPHSRCASSYSLHVTRPRGFLRGRGRAAFFAAFLDFAQRALWAAAIFSRASALNVRLVLALPAKLALAG